jgi:alginate O-acetyltransferase complex protein AlgI
MIFNSFEFLWLFPIIFSIYYLVTMRHAIIAHYPQMGNYLLIIVSYALYIKWKPIYALVLLGVTAITYFFALLIERRDAYGKKKYLIYLGIVLSVFPLILFKYYNFISTSLSEGLSSIGITIGLPGLNWAMPLGISFFTLQAIGYLSDVYLKRIEAEHNWWDYMLFVSFFPQIASGPISKAKDLLPQIKANRVFNYNQAAQGLKWLLWGMFIKVVVADSLGERVDIVYNDYINNGGVTCLVTSFLYSFQIYCDFAGYSFMAVGVGELMGFELINNFRRPYFSMTVTEFWHRWHISLSTWLKDYIYIPLGGNRCSKIRNYWNIFITFLVSGIWHGANWTFIVWGMLHGIFQIIEKMLGLSKKKSFGVIKWIRIILAFIIVDFTWIFFRMPSLTDAIKFISHILSNFEYSFDGMPYRFFLILVVLVKDLADEYDIKKMRLMHSENVIVRWVTYLVLISFICISGVYGGQFIYSGF